MNPIPKQHQNPKGLHQRYAVLKVVTTGEIKREPYKVFPEPEYTHQNPDPEAEYFPLRLDEKGSDPEHIAAGRYAIHAYADAIEHHLPKLAKDLRERYPLLKVPKMINVYLLTLKDVHQKMCVSEKEYKQLGGKWGVVKNWGYRKRDLVSVQKKKMSKEAFDKLGEFEGL